MKKFLLAFVMLFTIITQAQESIDVTVYQDARLAVSDDGRGNKPFTLDIYTKFEMQGNQQKYGYLVISPTFEYAEIAGIYKRYGADVGYVFNKLFIDNVEAGVSINFGIQDRYGLSFLTFGADFKTSYLISDKFKVNLLLQAVQRKDIDYFWGGNNIRCSGFVGVSYKIFQ